MILSRTVPKPDVKVRCGLLLEERGDRSNSLTSLATTITHIMTTDDRRARKIVKQLGKLSNNRVGKSWPTGNGSSSFSSEEGTVKANGSVRGKAVALRDGDGKWNVLPLEAEEPIVTNVVVDRRLRPKPDEAKFTFTIGFGGIRYPSDENH